MRANWFAVNIIVLLVTFVVVGLQEWWKHRKKGR
jgi:hypothetical protein